MPAPWGVFLQFRGLHHLFDCLVSITVRMMTLSKKLTSMDEVMSYDSLYLGKVRLFTRAIRTLSCNIITGEMRYLTRGLSVTGCEGKTEERHR